MNGLTRWRDPNTLAPWSAFRDMEDGFNRLLGELTRDFSGGDLTPALDIRETDEAFVVEAEMPGLTKDDITVSVREDVVTLKGVRSESREEEGEDHYHHVERRCGTIQRSFRIPGGFDADKIDAKYENGVLILTLPKRAEEQPKQISVNVN